MHMVIRVVVEANDVSEAVAQAEAHFEECLHYESGGKFDYCTPMVEGHTVSGADRWVDYKEKEAAFPLTSDPGRAEVEDAWNSTVEAARTNLKEVWDEMQESEDFEEFMATIMADEDLTRHRMNKVAGYSSVDYYLHVRGWNAGGVRSTRGWEYLQELMEEEEQHDENTWWVVPLDVHY